MMRPKRSSPADDRPRGMLSCPVSGAVSWEHGVMGARGQAYFQVICSRSLGRKRGRSRTDRGTASWQSGRPCQEARSSPWIPGRAAPRSTADRSFVGSHIQPPVQHPTRNRLPSASGAARGLSHSRNQPPRILSGFTEQILSNSGCYFMEALAADIRSAPALPAASLLESPHEYPNRTPDRTSARTRGR
jgi:hypothetical protein